PAEDDQAIERVLSEARTNADLVGRRAGHSDRPLPQTSPGAGIYDYSTVQPRLGVEPRIDLVKRLDDYVRVRYPDVINTDLVLNELAIEKALVTSEGARSYCLSPRVVLVVQLSVQGPDGPVQLYDVLGSFGEFEDQSESLAACEARVDRLYEDLRLKADGVYCEAG